LVNTGGSVTGPGVGPMCHPTILIPSIAARRITGACSEVSTLPRMMPSGLSAIAWLSAVVRPCTDPWPSRIRKSQPMTPAASCAPSPAPCGPPFRWSGDTYTISFFPCAAGPVGGPGHGVPGAVTIATESFATCRYAASVVPPAGAVELVPLLRVPPPPAAARTARSAAARTDRLPAMRNLYGRLAGRRRSPPLGKARERDRHEQRDAVEQRLDEERAAELLDA